MLEVGKRHQTRQTRIGHRKINLSNRYAQDSGFGGKYGDPKSVVVLNPWGKRSAAPRIQDSHGLAERAAALYHRGIICPAETWNLIGDAAGDQDLLSMLNSLPDELRELLRAVHRERPESLEAIADCADDSRAATLLQWCAGSDSEMTGDTESPPR